MTRDVASRFNAKMGRTFVLPEAKIQQQTQLIPGTDGQKMSKSKNNVIDIFLSDKALKKQIMSIKTNSTTLEAPKDWRNCNCFAIYQLLGSKAEVLAMKQNYKAGNYGYGQAKQALFELICKKFNKERSLYNHYIENPKEIEKTLTKGAKKAISVANTVLERVREKLGY